MWSSVKKCLFFFCFFFQGSPTNNVSPTSTPAKSSNAVPTLQPPPAAGAAGDGAAAAPAASEPAEEYVSAECLLNLCICHVLSRHCFQRLLYPLVNYVEVCCCFHDYIIILLFMNHCNAVNDNRQFGSHWNEMSLLIFSSSLLDLDPLSSSGPSAPSAAPTSWGGKYHITYRSKTFGHCCSLN